MRRPVSVRPIVPLFLMPLLVVAVAACSGASASQPPSSATPTTAPTQAAASPGASAVPSSESPAASPSASDLAPESGGTTAAGDIPDNAVFLRFRGGSPAFSIQYVEGWQVTPQPDGVVIRDKDSSETVALVAPADPTSYVSSTDLPALQAQAGFKLVKQDTVKVGSATYVHLVVHLPAPPDPVTGKQVPSTVDRYYVPGPAGLAIISLSTPDGVDNVDAFRQMIQSFKWA
jgi:hypothetical protein